MDEHSFLQTAIWIFGLLTLATIVHAVAKRLKFSFAVGLLSAGFLLHFVLDMFGMPAAESLEFSPEIVFYVFLPTLIFESAYHLNFRHFRSVFLEVSMLSTLGLFLSMAIIGAGLHFILGLPLGVALLFGSFISATDPVAVLAIFKELRAPKKLATIVDGESLLNDGTALVIFQFLLLHWAALDMGLFNLSQGALFFKNIVFGIIVGLVLGYCFSFAIAHSKSKGVQMTLSLVLAHVTFLLAEGILGVSGILATMAAGMMMGSFGKRKLSKETKDSFSNVWKFLEFISNSLIFLLLGIKLSQIPLFEHWQIVAITVFVALFLARPISVWASFFFINLFRKKQDKSPWSYQLLTIWGGIRGALAGTAVLLIPADFPYLNEFYAMTTGVILATFFVKATTIPFWLRRFRLIQLTNMENLQRLEAKILVNEKIRGFLQKMLDKKYISEEIFGLLEKKYGRTGNASENELQLLQKSLLVADSRESEKVLTNFALGIEMNTYRKLFELREVNENRFEILQGSILRQIDRLEKDILPDEDVVMKKYAPHISCTKCGGMFARFWDWRRRNQILDRYQHYRGRRIASWQVILDFESLREQHEIFADSDIVRKILKRYRAWHNSAVKKVEHLENQFPKIIKPFKIRMAENVCLKKERIIKRELYAKGLISEKVSQRMDEDIETRQEKCDCMYSKK